MSEALEKELSIRSREVAYLIVADASTEEIAIELERFAITIMKSVLLDVQEVLCKAWNTTPPAGGSVSPPSPTPTDVSVDISTSQAAGLLKSDNPRQL